MPQIYHAVPRCGIRRAPLVLSLLIEDEGGALLPVFLEYEVRGEQHALRLLPSDGYKGEDHYSLYTVSVPVAHLCDERFSYRFSVEGTHTCSYEFPLAPRDIPCDEDAAAPAILPLCPIERYYLSGGDLHLRFLTFPWDAAQTRVLVREGDVWHEYVAALNEAGEWACVLPVSLLNTLGGKLFYFVETQGACYSATLGSECAPLSMRWVDDAGPLLTSAFPADGETVSEDPPEIRIGYEDASGVDVRSSAVYLDGKNAGENAVWAANGMSFRPEMPLGEGEHVLEISLRDTRGNRSYHRFVFFVGEKDAPLGGKKRKPISTVQAAGFLANSYATLKKLFFDEE